MLPLASVFSFFFPSSPLLQWCPGYPGQDRAVEVIQCVPCLCDAGHAFVVGVMPLWWVSCHCGGWHAIVVGGMPLWWVSCHYGGCRAFVVHVVPLRCACYAMMVCIMPMMVHAVPL